MYCRFCGNKTPSDSRYCSTCGKDLTEVPAVVAAAPEPPHTPAAVLSTPPLEHEHAATPDSPRSGVCPVCRESSAVVKVSTLIDEGMSSGLSVGVGGTVIGPSAVGVGGAVTQTRTALARRLAPPPRPKQSFFTHWISWALAIATVIAFFVAIGVDVGFGGFMIGVMIGAVPGMLLGLVGATITVPANSFRWTPVQAEWDRKAARVRDAYYCRRDDVMFDSTVSGSPDQFKAKLDIPTKPRPKVYAPSSIQSTPSAAKSARSFRMDSALKSPRKLK